MTKDDFEGTPHQLRPLSAAIAKHRPHRYFVISWANVAALAEACAHFRADVLAITEDSADSTLCRAQSICRALEARSAATEALR